VHNIHVHSAITSNNLWMHTTRVDAFSSTIPNPHLQREPSCPDATGTICVQFRNRACHEAVNPNDRAVSWRACFTNVQCMSMHRMILWLFVPIVATAQWFVGAGVTYHQPENPTYKEVNRPALGGTALLMSRQYCHWWYGVRIEYSPLRPIDSLPPLRYGYTGGSMVAGELRWFPWTPTEVPLYASLALGLSSIATKPSVDFPNNPAGASIGVGYSIGIGGVLFYDSPCCGWFIDASLRYHAPNALVRSKYRPFLSSFQALVTFNYALGGGQ